MAAQGYINANTPIPICCNHASGSNWENNHYTPHLKRIQGEGEKKRSFNATYDKMPNHNSYCPYILLCRWANSSSCYLITYLILNYFKSIPCTRNFSSYSAFPSTYQITTSVYRCGLQKV